MDATTTPEERGLIYFERSPSKMGGSKYDYCFKIPRNYIQNQLIKADKFYKVYLGNTSIYFMRSPSKLGGMSDIDYCFKIPRNYVRNVIVNVDKTYKVYFETVSNPQKE